MPGTAIDLFLLYQFVRRLATPFTSWDAYKLGIIDSRGKVLKPRATLRGREKSAWGRYDILVANLKKMLGKVPGGRSVTGSVAAAMLLMKEQDEINEDDLEQIEERLKYYMDQPLNEMVAANAAGGGGVAGIGIGPDGEPGVHQKKKRRIVLTTVRRRQQNRLRDMWKASVADD